MNNPNPTTPIPINDVHPKQQLLAVDAKTLAGLLCCSVRHVERMDSAGKLPAPIHIGRAKRWILPEIRRWLAATCPDRKTWNAMKGVDT